MPTSDQTQARWIRCVHEAGHVCMAVHYSMVVESVVVPLPDGKGSHCNILFDHSPNEIASVYAAGEVAEELILGGASFAGSFDDVGRIWQLGQALQITDHPSWRSEVFRQTKEILLDRTDQLQTIAEAIRERTTLRQDEIAEYLKSQ